MARRKIRYAVSLSFVLWLLAWFWVFSFAYSGYYFKYNTVLRSILVAGGMIVAATCPISFFVVFNKIRCGSFGYLKGMLVHSGINLLSWIAFFLIVMSIAKLGGPAFLSADDAMGASIDIAICLGIVLVSIVLFIIAVGTVKLAQLKNQPRTEFPLK